MSLSTQVPLKDLTFLKSVSVSWHDNFTNHILYVNSNLDNTFDYFLATLVAQTWVCLQCGRPRFNLWVRKIPWRRKCWPTPQYACLENSMDRGAWWVIIHGISEVAHDWATNTFTFTFLAIPSFFRLLLFCN